MTIPSADLTGLTLRLWLDDERPMPISFDVHVRTAQAAIAVLSTMRGFVDEVSLDHDLGDYDGDCGDGYEVACFIENCAYNFLENVAANIEQRECKNNGMCMERLQWKVHSANPTGAAKMAVALRNADGYWKQAEDLLAEASEG